MFFPCGVYFGVVLPAKGKHLHSKMYDFFAVPAGAYCVNVVQLRLIAAKTAFFMQ